MSLGPALEARHALLSPGPRHAILPVQTMGLGCRGRNGHESNLQHSHVNAGVTAFDQGTVSTRQDVNAGVTATCEQRAMLSSVESCKLLQHESNAPCWLSSQGMRPLVGTD